MAAPVYSTNGAVPDTSNATADGLNGATFMDANAAALAGAIESVTHTRGLLTTVSANSNVANNTQAIPVFPDAVSDGMALTQNPSTTNQLEFAYAAGTAQISDTVYTYAGSTVAVGGGDATNPRIDLICAANANDSVVVVAGTPSATPAPPALPANRVPLANVYVPANAVAGGSDVTYTELSYLTPSLGGALPPNPEADAVPYFDGTAYATDGNLKYDADTKVLKAATVAPFGFERFGSDETIGIGTNLFVSDSSVGARAQALPPVATLPDGWECTVKNIGANGTNLSTDAANTFDETLGSPYAVSGDGQAVKVKYSASQDTFYIIAIA